MGAIFSRWRKKHSTLEVLNGLEKEIESLENVKRTNLERQKKIIGSLILYSVLLYIGTAVFFYFYQWQRDWKHRIVYLTPLLIFPVIVWLVKRFLHWYFVKRISKNELALEELKNKKKAILEEVMEKETYKKAKEILEKFDPDRFKKLEDTSNAVQSQTPVVKETPQNASSGLRQRKPLSTGPTPLTGTPHLPPGSLHQRNQLNVQGTPRGPPLPRPILPRDRSSTERLMEYLVGDGPQNRYALICKGCHSHNGMALKEEFDFIAFRCCYCYYFNPARKQKPQAPRVEVSSPSNQMFDEPSDDNVGELSEDSKIINSKDNNISKENVCKSKEVTESVVATCDQRSEISDIDMLTDESDLSYNKDTN